MAEIITMGHGAGGRLSHELITRRFLPIFRNDILKKLEDSATFELSGKIAFTTDSYVVNPIFFPGGDIGRLSVCGTVNDLSMSGAKPLYLGFAVIMEEGFALLDLERIIDSAKQAAEEAGVTIVTGDTKVVNRGAADKIFINTSGIGLVPPGVEISVSGSRPGDAVIVSGSLGDHGVAILSQREGLKFKASVKSDCAPLNHLVAAMLEASGNIRCLRDPTRGGLATLLCDVAAASGVGLEVEEARIPVHKAVNAACEMLGLDPLYLANEGKLVTVVEASDAEKVIGAMRREKYGTDATIIGRITAAHPGRVVLKTQLGTSRILNMPGGELLPRIC